MMIKEVCTVMDISMVDFNYKLSVAVSRMQGRGYVLEIQYAHSAVLMNNGRMEERYTALVIGRTEDE